MSVAALPVPYFIVAFRPRYSGIGYLSLCVRNVYLWTELRRSGGLPVEASYSYWRSPSAAACCEEHGIPEVRQLRSIPVHPVCTAQWSLGSVHSCMFVCVNSKPFVFESYFSSFSRTYTTVSLLLVLLCCILRGSASFASAHLRST